MKDKLTSQSLLLTGLNTSESFSLRYSGRTSFQPIGTVTGTVKLQFSNDNVSFFDLETGLDVSQPFVIETTDYNFYRFVVTTIGTGTVKWSIANSDIIQDSVSVFTGGGVTSFNTRTGNVVPENGDYTTDQTTETSTRVFVTPSQKTAIIHSNRSVLDLISEAFTTALKNAYDSTVTWISTNGANILNHLSSTSNPHNTTASQVGAYTTSQVDTALLLKEDSANKHTTTIVGSETNNVKFPTIKQVVDWVTSLFVPKSRTITINGTTQDLSTDRTFTISTTGTTNLTTTQTSTTVTINSDTGTDAVIPLANGTNAGVSSNDYTTAERTKLSSISGINTGDQDLSGLMVKANNLSDLTNTATARTNLGLGTLATQNGTFTDKQDTLVSGANIKTIDGDSILESGSLKILDRTRSYFFNDLLSATALHPLIGTAISIGTFAQNTTNFSVNSLGVCRVAKSATANSGYRIQSDITAIRIKGGEYFAIRINPLLVATQTFRAGFIDATTVTDCVDGVYCEFANSGDLVLKTSNNSTRTTSNTLSTLSLNTWYTIEIIVNSNATSVVMNLYDATGVLIGEVDPITTNIPTGVNRVTGVGFISTGSSSTPDALIDVDFYEFKQTITR